MSNLSSDAIVFFGASGDLAYKQIFPSLLRLVRDEQIRVPIIGVAKSGWNLENLKERAKDSLEKHGGVDPDSLQLLTSLLRYVDGDYWRFQLETAHRYGDGVVLWGPDAYVWNDKSGWWDATEKFAASLHAGAKD